MKNYMKKLTLTRLIIFTLFIAVTLLFIGEKWLKNDDFLYELFRAIAIAALTTGIFSYFILFIDENRKENEKNQILRLLAEEFLIIKKCYEYGLINIHTTFPLDNSEIKNDLLLSQEVSIVMNDSKVFLTNNKDLINERLSASNKTTNLILIDYEQKDTMSVLTRKNEHEEGYYENKITEFLKRDIKNMNKEKTHALNIYFNSNYNTMAIILLDNYAMISLFRISSGIDIVPNLVFKNGGIEYQKVFNDINNLKKKCRLHDV